MIKISLYRSVANRQGRLGLRRKCFENACVWCSAVAYCCGAVAPRAIAALLGRFLPRLGALVYSSGPFFFFQGDRPLRRRVAAVASTKLCAQGYLSEVLISVNLVFR